MTDEEWRKFQQWRGGGSGPSAGQGESGKLPGQSMIETVGAFGQGALKGLAGMGAPPGGVSLNEADPKGPIATWAKSEQTEHPWAEKAGRWTAEYGPLAALPDIDAAAIGGAGARAFARSAPKLAHIAERGLQGAWKGAVGGETQGNPGAGAATGGGGATAAAIYRSLPPMLQWGLPFLALSAAKTGMGGREVSGWGEYHLAHPLAALAAILAGGAPGVAGALGAQAVGRDNGQDQTGGQ